MPVFLLETLCWTASTDTHFPPLPPSLPPSLPRSLGIHSKKYIEDDPATKPLKTQENLAAIKVRLPSLPPSLLSLTPSFLAIPFMIHLSDVDRFTPPSLPFSLPVGTARPHCEGGSFSGFPLPVAATAQKNTQTLTPPLPPSLPPLRHCKASSWKADTFCG